MSNLSFEIATTVPGQSLMENSDITLPASHIMCWSDEAQKLFDAFKGAENRYVELQKRNGELIAERNALRQLVAEAASHMAHNSPDAAPFNQPLWERMNEKALGYYAYGEGR